jgi:8-oxo-dGTP pyrophosphatase MutT (NUDIX family)
MILTHPGGFCPSPYNDAKKMTEVTRHFTATTFIVHGSKVLLHRHPKQGLWLPPGGHIERDELPHEAALREIEEETGLKLHLHSEEQAAQMSGEMDCLVVPLPAFILVEDINPFHQHIDLTYFAELPTVNDAAEPSNVTLQQNGFAWFSPEDLNIEGVPQNVKAGALRAIKYIQ